MSGSLRNVRRKPCSAASVGQRRAGVGDRDELRAASGLAPRSARRATASRSSRRTSSRRGRACGRGRCATRRRARRRRRSSRARAGAAARPASPNDCRMTSGASDEPPMPEQHARRCSPRPRPRAANASRSSTSSASPRRSSASRAGSATSACPCRAPQRVVLLPDAPRDVLVDGLRSMRCGDEPLEPRRAARTRSSAAAPVTIASRLDSMPASSFSIGVTNASMPSRSSFVGDVVHVDARPRRARSRSGAGSIAAVSPATCDALGGGQQRRHRHRVDRLGRRRARRRTSCPGTRGFLTPVDAHSGRWTGAPASQQRGEALAVEDLLEAPVGGARVGQPGAALRGPRGRAARGACRPRCRRARRRSSRPSARRASGPPRGGARGRGCTPRRRAS